MRALSTSFDPLTSPLLRNAITFLSRFAGEDSVRYLSKSD